MIDFKPSEVFLDVIPLVGTMHKAEYEITSASIIRALVIHGDEWKPISLHDIVELVKSDVSGKVVPYYHWYTNPFIHADPRGLVDKGFAVFGNSDGRDTIELTETGKEALRRWVRKKETAQ